jgi:hypothetical protein
MNTPAAKPARKTATYLVTWTTETHTRTESHTSLKAARATLARVQPVALSLNLVKVVGGVEEARMSFVAPRMAGDSVRRAPVWID